jgi:hypothetical protein
MSAGEIEPFTCVICEQQECQRWAWRPQDIGIAPICKRCEHAWSTCSSWNGSSRDQGKVNAGAFGDRRMARRLFAISEALHTTATRIEWSAKNAA